MASQWNVLFSLIMNRHSAKVINEVVYMLIEIRVEVGCLRDWLSGALGVFFKDSAMIFEGERIVVGE